MCRVRFLGNDPRRDDQQTEGKVVPLVTFSVAAAVLWREALILSGCLSEYPRGKLAARC